MLATLTLPRLSLRLALLLSLLLVAAAESFNYATGHSLVCRCGDIKLFHAGRADAELSQHLADWLTYAKLLQGVALHWLLTFLARGHLSVAARLVLAVLLGAAWEVIENSAWLAQHVPAFASIASNPGDTILNSTFDILALIAGFLIASRLPAWIVVFLFVSIEIGFLYATGDSFLLRAYEQALILAGRLGWS